jgi:hypothetical protein
MRERCPVCRFWFERNDGYFIGATCVNLVLAIVLPALAYIVILAATWPRPPWLLAGLVAGALVIAVPIMLFPFARVVWLALDLSFRPIEPVEYERRHALD